jgi:hypothetical protein
LHEIERFAPLQITTPAFEVVVPQWTAPVAVSNSPWRCLGLTLLGMDARQVAAGPPLLIVRPSLGDANPLSPYLSDVELSFWAGLLSASLIAGLALRRSEKGIRPK